MDGKQLEFQAELDAIKKKLEDPGIFSTPEYPRLAKRQSELQEIIDLYNEIAKIKERRSKSGQLLESADPELAELARAEIAELTAELAALEARLNALLTPSDPNDGKDVIMEIRAAAGGDESGLFAGELYRMYARWAEAHGYKTELVSESPSEAGGFKEIIFAVRGAAAYKNLKFEAGVHRVQRVPATESQGRVHTSTVTVAVMPEAEETDVEINPNDLRVDVFRSGGHGGQSVNTTDSAVRITHLPTGLVVTNQDEKSQIKNKAKALSILRSRLLQMKIEREQAELSEARRKLIGSGDRAEKIRTYNFPQDRITDHRVSYSRSNLAVALNGAIDDLIERLQSAEHDLLKHEN